MFLLRRFVMCSVGMVMMTTASGCFFGGNQETTESVIVATREQEQGAIEVEEALFRADMAIEEERFDTAVIEYNRAIRADSSNVDAYFELALLHQQLSAQYRDEGDIEAALRENTRALRVLSNLVNYQSRPEPEPMAADSTAPGMMPGAAPSGMPMEGSAMPVDSPTTDDVSASSMEDTPASSSDMPMDEESGDAPMTDDEGSSQDASSEENPPSG